MAMSECELDNRIEAIVRDTRRLLSYHPWNSKHSPKGWPDRVYARKAQFGGAVMFRELKRQGEHPTPDQEECLQALRAAGLDADVWRPVDLVSGRIARELAALAGLAVPGA